ncbi:MAG: CarD family transcriptional regulator [Sedimentibacter sp.]
MFKINELVVYGNEGVCKIDDIRNIDIAGIDTNKLYYVLNPIYSPGKIVYAPIDTKVFMRTVITSETAQNLIDQIPNIDFEEYNNTNLRELNDFYKSLISSHNCKDLFKLIGIVYTKEKNATKNKKKLGQTDKNYMRVAEELLHGEFAAALGIPKDDVKNYIENRVQEREYSM